MKSIIIERLVTGPFQVNCYLVGCPQTKKAVIIDPGGEVDQIHQMIDERGLTPLYILNTHGHADHVVGNTPLHNALNIPVCMHGKDDTFFADPAIRDVIEKELGLSAPARTDRCLCDGDLLMVGSLKIAVIHTPGHSPGSVCYLIGGNLFTGDTLFVGDVGRTDLTGGSFETLLASIKTKILPLPDDTIIHPGHDYGETPTSTLAWEKRENPYIAEFILTGE
jgi:hydroxyacylglutathione hydrolase